MKLGDCYEAAFQYMLSEGPGSGLKLIHAEVMGQVTLKAYRMATHLF